MKDESPIPAVPLAPWMIHARVRAQAILEDFENDLFPTKRTVEFVARDVLNLVQRIEEISATAQAIAMGAEIMVVNPGVLEPEA